MTVTHGMDTSGGRLAGTQLQTGAQEIRVLAGRLEMALHSFDWTGTDADRTREAWQTHERPALDDAATHLAGLAAQLLAEAEAQDAASDHGSDHGSGGSTAVAAAPAAPGLLSRIGSWISDRVGAFAAGMARAREHDADYWNKISDVVSGREDWSLAEIAASAILATGSEVGAVVGAVTGEDPGVFTEGAGRAGVPVAVPTDATRAGPFQPALTRPVDLPTLMQGVADGYEVGGAPGSTGDVRITRIDNGTGVPGYVVAVPGTESWSPAAGTQPRDLTGNVQLVAGNPTAAAESVRAAMDAAGIPPGSPVMVVGHSQGGIIAGTLAADPAFVERYNVTHVMTYGSPIDHLAVDPRVNVLQVQHGNDWVPRLDLGGVGANGFPQAQPTVTLDSPSHFFRPDINHDYGEYQDSVGRALRGDDESGRMLRDYQSTLAPFLVRGDGTATAVDVPVRRGD